jgi:Fe-S-cluster containining protein
MPDQIIRDIPLIRRYSRNNEADDMRFRTFYKHRLDMSNAKLDEIVRQTTDDVWKQIDCLACGNCCRTLQIVVDSADVKRLALRLGLNPAQFRQKYVVAGTGEFAGEQYLKSAPCVFLGEGNRCAVYEDRPQACRDFPYLHEPGFRQRSFAMLSNMELCPIVFNVWRELKRRLGWRRR